MTAIANLENARKYFIPGDPAECWHWTGYINPKGYGWFNVVLSDGRRTTTSAHRAVYLLLVGPISGDLEVDHLCRQRSCVNPTHLEAVPHIENVRRIPPEARASWGVHHADKTHCPQGHAYDETNTYHYGGRRHCRECKREQRRAWDRRVRLRGAA